jgi:hypothetical protein
MARLLAMPVDTSSTITLAPLSWATMAAGKPEFPPPTTMTSASPSHFSGIWIMAMENSSLK